MRLLLAKTDLTHDPRVGRVGVPPLVLLVELVHGQDLAGHLAVVRVDEHRHAVVGERGGRLRVGDEGAEDPEAVDVLVGDEDGDSVGLLGHGCSFRVEGISLYALFCVREGAP